MCADEVCVLMILVLQLHLESTDTDESSKLLLSGELPRRHWAFQGPEVASNQIIKPHSLTASDFADG